jgi:hypothetical protein
MRTLKASDGEKVIGARVRCPGGKSGVVTGISGDAPVWFTVAHDEIRNYLAVEVVLEEPSRADPIAIPVRVHLSGEARERALRRLCALHGHPNGVPPDENAPPALVEATHAPLRGREIDIVIKEIAPTGELVFGLATELP